MIQTHLKNNDMIALLWTMEDMDKVTIFTFDKDKKLLKYKNSYVVIDKSCLGHLIVKTALF